MAEIGQFRDPRLFDGKPGWKAVSVKVCCTTDARLWSLPDARL